MSAEETVQNKPTLVVELLGPDDFAGKVMHRAVQFMSAGVQLLWLIDYVDRCAIVYRADGPPFVVESGGELTGEDVLPGFRCLVDEFLPPAEPHARKT